MYPNKFEGSVGISNEIKKPVSAQEIRQKPV